MKRTVNLAIAVGFALAILAGIWISLSPTHARTITVDAQDDWVGPDWAMSPLATPNLAHIGRDLQKEGEYIWTDNENDARTDIASQETDAEMLQFRVTGDEENIYFAAWMKDITLTSTEGAPQIQIAIDTDRQNGVGELWLAGWADTKVNTAAQWEYLLQTQFVYADMAAVRLYTADWSSEFVGHTAISVESNIIEMSVPWSSLGFSGPPTQPLRMTVAVCRESNDGNCINIDGASDILDAITNYGDPGATSNTWDEVQDGTLDYYFDLFFQPDGEVYAPLLVSEVLYDASGTEPASEFIELYNAAPISLPLAMYKVGDEEAPGGGEGMEALPGGWIEPGEVIVVANNAQTFLDAYGFLPDYAFNTAGLPVSATTNYATWASGSVQLSNDGDEVLLLDPCDTIIDVAVYENLSWPGMTGESITAEEGESIARCPSGVDTNDMSYDFALQGNDGTPAQVCYVDFSMQKSVSPSTVRRGDELTYTIVLSNAGNAILRDGDLRDSLPGDVAFVRWINASGATLSGNLITWSGDISANTEIPISFVVRHQAGGKTVTNTAVFTYAGESYQADATYVAEVSPELAFTKDASPANVDYHGLITYTLEVSNSGDGDASGVMMTDTLPAEVDFFDWLVQPPNATVSNDVVTWNGSVAAQQSISLSFRVRHVASTWGALTNEATCTGDGRSLNGSAQVIITEPMPELHISKRVTPTAVGYLEPLTYTVIISNTGDRDANGVWMTDTLPSEVSFSRWVQQPPGATYANGVITWTGVVSTAPQTFVFVVTNTSRSPRATVSNLARYTHESGSGSATADYTVQAPSVTLLKEVSPVAMQRMGEIITYTITLSNDGNASATSAVLTDTLPSALTFGGWVFQPGGAVEVSGTITWTGELASADTMGLVFTATLDGLHFDEIITNTAFFAAEGLPLLRSAASFATPRAHTIYLPLVMRDR